MGNKKSNKGHSKNANKQKKNTQTSGSKGGAFDIVAPTPRRGGKKKAK